MSTAIQTVQGRLNSLSAMQIVNDEMVGNKFVDIFNKVHGVKNGEQIYEMEKFQFNKILAENPPLQNCTKLSLYGVFIDMAAQGLSFDKTKKLCYVMPYNVKVGEAWESRASLEISPYGELAIRQSLGQIRGADEPVVVYEGDAFEAGIKDGQKYVNYTLNTNHSGIVIGCFVRIVKNDGNTDYAWLLKEDIERLKSYSAKKNKNGGANALYTSIGGQIDPGFLKAKTIKHAFKSYPKVQAKGVFSKIQEFEEVGEVDYGIDVTNQAVPVSQQLNQANGNGTHNAQDFSSNGHSEPQSNGPGNGTSRLTVDDENF